MILKVWYNISNNVLGVSMKRNYMGIDILRGLGIFIVVSLHTAFIILMGYLMWILIIHH